MFRLNEERLYEEIKKLGLELHTPVPETFWKLEVFDRCGRVLQSHRQRARSWVRNTYNMIATHLMGISPYDGVFGAGNINYRDTGGTVRTSNYVIRIQGSNTDPESAGCGFRGNAGSNAAGIVIGSNNGAWSFEHHQLLTQIGHGAGAGQLVHQASDAPVKGYDAGTKTWTIEYVRFFNNNSGGDVTVNEVGIYCNGGYYTNIYRWMVTRDVLGAAITIPDTGQLKITYTIELAYPA